MDWWDDFTTNMKEGCKSIVDDVVEIKDKVSEKINDGVNYAADVVRDRRTASVVVVNNTGGDIRDVHVKHKYSGNFRSCLTWSTLEARGVSNPPLTVEHATGKITTGMDWWFVCWTDADGNLFHNSSNVFLENLKLAEDAAMAITAVPTGGGAAGLKAASIVGADVSGYRQHTLTSESGVRPIRIVLTSDGVMIDSPGKANETFSLIKKQASDWKGWNPEFEKVWDLEFMIIKGKLYDGFY